MDNPNDDGGDEGDGLAHVEGDPHVNLDGQLNGPDQDDGEGDGLENEGQDQEDHGDRDQGNPGKVRIGDQGEVISEDGLSGQVGLRVIAVHDLTDGVDLVPDLIRRRLIFGVDHDHLVAIFVEILFEFLGQKILGDGWAQDGVGGDDGVDPVDILNLIHHGREGGIRQVLLDHHEVGGGHVVVLLHLIQGNDGVQILGEGPVQVIVDFGIDGPVDGRNKEEEEEDKEGLFVLDAEIG